MTSSMTSTTSPTVAGSARRLTGAQIIAESLIMRGVPFAVGIPGQ
jgi:hypothetical protein